MQRNWPQRDGQFSELVAALQRDFPEAVIERRQNGRNWNRSFAAPASDVSHADLDETAAAVLALVVGDGR